MKVNTTYKVFKALFEINDTIDSFARDHFFAALITGSGVFTALYYAIITF